MKLLCAISHHGLGHLAQAAPVLNAMGEMRPDLEWLVWSALPRSILEGRLKIPFHHRQDLADVGLLMHDAMRVDVAASRMAYLAFHQHWHTRVAREADWLKRENVDGVLSNAAYLPLAAASHAGKASVGFCSLNWWDIAHAYLHDAPDMQPVFIEMRQAYLGAQAFLRLTPGLPMAWLSNLEVAPPVASLGRNRRKHLNQRLGLAPDQKWVLLGFGGVTYQHTAPLPALPHITWLAPDGWQKEDRADLVHFTQAGLPFPDLLASCDALVTKVGYGSFVESAGLGLPVLFLDRPDWPETPWLASWLAQHTRAAAISEEMLFSPDIGAALARLWQAPVPKAPDVSGAAAIGRRILNCLGG
jgi:hypothetical protein